jgi:GDP/UDP-N,N'-diacetylbacillosamine 2-epimerase (hydrolysing)
MNKIFKEACEKFPNLFFLNSIGQENYLSLVSISIFIIGNSSSGLLEAPSLRIPTINVGSRQDGRPKAQSVIDVDCTKTSIRSGIQKALSKEFLKSMNDVENPYGPPGASQKIFNILELMDFSQSFQKKFYDGTEGDENHS